MNNKRNQWSQSFSHLDFDKKQYLDAIKVHHYSYKLLSGIDRHYCIKGQFKSDLSVKGNN